MFRQARLGLARRGAVTLGKAGKAWRGNARFGMARQAGAGAECLGEARCGGAWIGKAGLAWRGVVGRVMVRSGLARQAWLGGEGLGIEWSGLVRQGKVRQARQVVWLV